MENIIRLSVYACLSQFSPTECHKGRDITKQMPKSKMKAVDWSSDISKLLYEDFSVYTISCYKNCDLLWSDAQRLCNTLQREVRHTHEHTYWQFPVSRFWWNGSPQSHIRDITRSHRVWEKKDSRLLILRAPGLNLMLVWLYFINYWFVHTTLFISAKHFEGWTSRWYENMDWQERIFCSSALWSEQWVAVKCSSWKCFECEGLFHALWLSASTVLVHTVAT